MERTGSTTGLAPVSIRTSCSALGNAANPVHVFRVAGLQPKTAGPWRHEADKLAWVDAATGSQCVILRTVPGGHLRGYVGIEIGDAMFGWSHDEIPSGLGIRVHGGLDYSEVSGLGGEHDEEMVGVDHFEVHGSEDPRWWFGFGCDKSGDLVPDASDAFMAYVGDVPVYRDERFVFEQCTALAQRLLLIGKAVDLLTNDGPAAG